MWEERLKSVEFHRQVADGMLYMSIPTFIVLYWLIDSPWGKHAPIKGKKWWLGPLLPAKISWFAFEVQNLIWCAYCYSRRDVEVFGKANRILLSLFVLHYINRAILHPLRLGPKTQRMPLAVVIAAIMFCTCNGYLQASNLCRFQSFPQDYTTSLPFLSGTFLFFLGMWWNLQSDAILRQLKRQGRGYQIPRGGLFDYCSGAHYFGEMVEWGGFAAACHFSRAPCAFWVYTAANLIPRAVSHHAWYQQHFRDYPRDRRAVIPFLW